MACRVENQAMKGKCYTTCQKLSSYKKGAETCPCGIRSLLDYDRVQCAESSDLKNDWCSGLSEFTWPYV